MIDIARRLDALSRERRRYTLETLAAHLDEAGQSVRLHDLLAEKDWMQARVKTRGYRYDAYLRDLDTGFQNTLNHDVGEADIARAVRLSLMSSTIAGLARSVPPSLVAEAARRSVWPVSRALGIASTTNSHLDRQQLCWQLLQIDHLDAAEAEEIQALLDADGRSRKPAHPEYWAEMAESKERARGGWVSPEVEARARALLCRVEPFLTVARDVEGETDETPVVDHTRVPHDPQTAAARERFQESSPKMARLVELTAWRYAQAMAGRGLEAIRTVPGFGNPERAEAEALLRFSLAPDIARLGLPDRVLKERSRLLDADAVVGAAGSIEPSQARAMFKAVLKAREAARSSRGNPHRARAFAALAPRLAGADAVEATLEMLNELEGYLTRAHDSDDEDGGRIKWGSQKMRSESHRAGRRAIDLYFDDYVEIDEGIDLDFHTYVEDLSDLEVEYAAFGRAMEALATQLPDEVADLLIGLSVAPVREYGWVCITALCAVSQRLAGEESEFREALLDQALETIELLPPFLRTQHWGRLAPVLDDSQIRRTLAEIRGVHDRPAQAEALAALASRSDDVVAMRHVADGLRAATGLRRAEERLRALIALAPLVDPSIERQAVDLARELETDAQRMRAVAELAPRLSDKARDEAVDWAFQLGVDALPDTNFEDAQLAEAWSCLLPHLDDERRVKGLEVAVGLVDDQAMPSDFRIGVQQLGPFLDARSVEILETHQWKPAEDLLLYLHSCAGHLYSSDQQADILERTSALPSAKDRLDCFAELYPHLSNELRTRCAEAAWDLAVAAQDASVAAAVVDDVSQERLVSTIDALDYESSWGVQLVRVSSKFLPQVVIDAILANTADSSHGLDYLAALVDRVDATVRHDAMRVALEGTDESASQITLESMLSVTDAVDRAELVVRMLAMRRAHARSEVLALISTDAVLDLLSEELSSNIATSIVDVCQNWDWP